MVTGGEPRADGFPDIEGTAKLMRPVMGFARIIYYLRPARTLQTTHALGPRLSWLSLYAPRGGSGKHARAAAATQYTTTLLSSLFPLFLAQCTSFVVY